MPQLFDPFPLKSIVLRNRIGVSPMCQYASENGHATDWHLVHLGRFALGGAGLVSLMFIRDPHWLLLSMVGVGFAWASILSLPYALLSDSVPASASGTSSDNARAALGQSCARQ